MTDEEKKVIKKLEYIKHSGICQDWLYNFEAGTILNLIQRQQEELEKKDKVIDLMAECIAELDNCKSSMCNKFNSNCIVAIRRDKTCLPCIKQYFEKKVGE